MLRQLLTPVDVDTVDMVDTEARFLTIGASGVTLGSNASLVITYSSAVVALAMMTAFLWVAVNFNKRGSGYSRYSRSRNRRGTNDKGELDSCSGDGSHVLTLFNAVVLVASNVL